nr:hypothetical protein [Frankia sp. Cppng1_Ct_nod]
MAAAGAVGATAGQIAKAMGCRVIGSAGSAAKVRFLAGDMSRWLREGTVRNVETVVHGGVEAAWPTFLAMLRGDNVGKMIVHLGSLSSQ